MIQTFLLLLQDCPIDIAHYFVYAEEVNMTVPPKVFNKRQFAESAKFTESSEWSLKSFVCKTRQHQRKSFFSFHKRQTVNFIRCTIRLQRRSLFYMYNLVMPCLVLLILGVLSFCLPVDSSDRISLTMTLLLAMMVFLMVLMEKMPPTSTVIPLMGK